MLFRRRNKPTCLKFSQKHVQVNNKEISMFHNSTSFCGESTNDGWIPPTKTNNVPPSFPLGKNKHRTNIANGSLAVFNWILLVCIHFVTQLAQLLHEHEQGVHGLRDICQYEFRQQEEICGGFAIFPIFCLFSFVLNRFWPFYPYFRFVSDTKIYILQ